MPSTTQHTPLLALDTVVDHYVDHDKVIREIGRGGMGEVYLARDPHLGRKVALKLVRGDALGDTRALQRLLREARVWRRIPVIWRGGVPVRQAPPTTHRCNQAPGPLRSPEKRSRP